MLLLAARGRSDGAGGVTAPPQRTFRRSHSLGRSLPAHGIHLEGGLPASTGRCLPSQSPAVPGQLGGRNYPGWISSRTWPEVSAILCQRALREVTGRRAVGCSVHLIYVRKTVRVFVCGNGFQPFKSKTNTFEAWPRGDEGN